MHTTESEIDRLSQIYGSVAARKYALARVSGIRPAATIALLALEAYLRKPSAENLKAFELAELAWAGHTSRPTTCFADELRALSKQGPIDWKPAGMNTNNNINYDPYSGFVYSMWSKQRPNNVKLGVTSRHPTDRQTELKKKTGYEHLEILFFFEIGKPREVEHELHKRLGTYLDVQHHYDSREWFRFSPKYALESVKSVIDYLKVKRFSANYINKRIAALSEDSAWLNDKSYFGGIRVKRTE